MVMTNSQWTRTTSLIEYEKPMFDEAISNTWEYGQVFGDQKKLGPGDQEIRGYLWSGLGLPHERKFGEDIQTESMSEIGEWTLSDVEIALGSDIDDKLLEDMRHITEKQFLNRLGTSMGESFSQARCLYAASVFNRAFSTTAGQVMYDGKALCADDHPLYNTGEVYDNSLAAGSVSFSNIWDMIDKLRIDQFTHNGLRKRGTPDCILLHDSHERDINRILNQQYEFDGIVATGESATSTTHVSSKNVNSLAKKKLKVVYCIELEDTDDNFMLGKNAKQNLVFRIRKSLSAKWEFGRRNRTRSVFNHMRLMTGVIDYVDIIGRPGT